PRPPRRGGARVLRHAGRARRGPQEGGRAVPGARGRAVHRAVLEADRRLAGRYAGPGPAMKTTARWRSERVGREVSLVRWGTFGQPVLLFPTAGGDAEEVERMHLIGACGPLIDAGKIKLYSCDSVAGAALLAREGDARHQMWLQNQFHQYIRHEVVPAIRSDCESPDLEVWAAGASIGAFHAVAAVCRFPDVFARACAMSGTYDLRRFYDAKDFTDEFWVSSPLHFLAMLDGPHLEKLRTRFILLISGEGR